MQCACAIVSTVAWPALHYFSTLPHKRHKFRKTLLNIKSVFWFSLQLLSKTFLILSRNERDTIKNVQWSSHKALLFLFDLNETLKNAQILNFTWARPVGAELFQADGRADMTKLKFALRNFANTHKNRKILLNISQHDTPPSSGEFMNEYSYASRLQLYLYSPFCVFMA